MKIVICDDDEHFIHQLESFLRKYERESEQVFTIYCYQNIDNMCTFLRTTTDIDLLFLDVRFSDYTGVEKAREIRDFNKTIIIIFVSSYIKFATQGYDVNAAGYLVKPFMYQTFKDKFDSILEKTQNSKDKFLYDKTNIGNVVLNFNDIVYIETYERNVKIHTPKNTYIGYKNMKDYEKLLYNGSFFRCHAAYIVNMQYINKLEKMSLFLKDGTELTISKTKKKAFMDCFLSFIDCLVSSEC